jgi:hypothetical protein
MLVAQKLESLEHIVLDPHVGVDVEGANYIVDRGGRFVLQW